MKYGDTLQQRSIPLWETYNVDYNDIKHLIKVRTTHGQGQAKAIGSINEAKQLKEFEGELYRELRDQHQRISLFVQSKAGEIARRLAHLDKQIAQLEKRTFTSGQIKISVRRLEKFSRAEAATLEAGEEIQFLSRFVEAQRLAFQKLLKKYRRWTNSADLGKRFRDEILDRPTSFSKRDFQPLLAQWTEVLARVRAPFESETHWTHKNLGPKYRPLVYGPSNRKVFSDQEADRLRTNASNSLTELHSSWESGSGLELDAALAMSPSGPGAARAVYWVHADNIVQLHVLLLQYTRLQRLDNPGSAPGKTPRSRSSPRSSVSANGNKPFPHTDEDIGVIICDDLQDSARWHAGLSTKDPEARPGVSVEAPAAIIRYSSNGEAVVIINGFTERHNQKQAPMKAKINCEIIHKLLNPSKTGEEVFWDGSGDPERLYDWFAKHREVQPIVQIQARRTRFAGLKNSNTGGIWATLDKCVLMENISQDSMSYSQILNANAARECAGSNAFPHAVLEVRAEGDPDNDLIAQLDASHLTERIPTFSLEIHAMATLCKRREIFQPPWLPDLERDIRKVPAATEVVKERASQSRLNFEQSSSQHTSITTNGPSGSGFSAVQDESSATSAPDNAAPQPPKASKKTKRQSNRRQILKKGLREQSRDKHQKSQRYWNEFDDGSEGSEDEAYTILVYPHASRHFPSAATASKLLTSMVTPISVAAQKFASWFRPTRGSNSQHERLINHDDSPIPENSDLSDEECASRNVHLAAQPRYLTFASLPQSSTARARENLLFRSCLTSFGASFVLLILAAILNTTGRRKAEIVVDAGVIIGVAASLVFAIIAVTSMLGRKENIGWVHRSSVILLFATVVVCGGVLLASLA